MATEKLQTNTRATWTVGLLCQCPHCEQAVNLCDEVVFWGSHPSLRYGEDRTGEEFTCPECFETIIADTVV